jgi:putative PIN family toxin of toxin-antitoxin system
MTRVIFDTNIFVSGLVFGGRMQLLIEKYLNSDFELCLCDELKTEVLSVLVSKFGFSFEDLQIADQLVSGGRFYPISKPYPKISRDQKDNYLLSLIDVSQAQFLVTGDKDLLVLGEYAGCRILKPSEFLAQ